MRKCKRFVAGVIVFSLMASLLGCHKTGPSDVNSTTGENEDNPDYSDTFFQVGEDTTTYFSCKKLDYKVPDNKSLMTVYGGLISDTSVWTVVLANDDYGTVYLEQFDLDGNREDTIAIGTFQDVDLGYETPYMYEDDQSIYIVSKSYPQSLKIFSVEKQNHSVGESSIKLATDFSTELLGFRQDLFYVKGETNNGECVLYGYDLSSGECKFKTEPDAEARFYVWMGDTLFQLNMTPKGGVYRAFEHTATGGVKDCGEYKMPDEYGMVHYYNGKQFYEGDKGIWYLNEETGVWESIILWSNSGIDVSDMYVDLRVVSKDLDRILTCGRDTKYVSLFQSGENPREGKTKLLAVGYYVPEKVLAAIQEFNDSNDDCFIEYKEYEEIVDPDDYLDKDGYTDYDAYGEAVFDYIWKAIGKGEGPDILFRESDRSCDKFDSRFFEYGGLLQDMSPLWEQEDLAWREMYYTNLFDVMKNGNALYSIPYQYNMVNYVILDKAAADTKPTYSAWLKYMDEHADGRALFRMTGQDFLLKCLCYDASSFIDEKAGKSQFSCQEFKDLLRLSKEYCMSIDEWNNFSERESILAENRILGAGSAIAMGYDYDTNGQYYGLISKDGGHACLLGDSISITSKCEDVEGAWEFIKVLLSPGTQEYDMRPDDPRDIVLTRCPVLRSSLDYMLDFDMNPMAHEEYWWHYSCEAELEEDWTPDDVIPMTEEEAQTVRDFISSVDYVYYPDYEIVNVVMEESAPYFSGQKSLDDVVAIIDNRVQTILNERQ